ncbi:MAG: DUF3842 family protein [Eubacterium sp.]|nr:DUF3842 family protein [Eubacterium sp.]
MNILIIDGQGGGVGRQLIEKIKKIFPEDTITAVGTNAIAAQTMLKAGADRSATGENAVVVGCRKADIIIGPVGIAIADSLWGEITPKMAIAVAQSDAMRILLPMNLCDNFVVGTKNATVSQMVEEVLEKIHQLKADMDRKHKNCYTM